MLFHERNEYVPMIPPTDSTGTMYSTWVDMRNWHHGAIFMNCGAHQDQIVFNLRKGRIATLEGKNKNNQGVAFNPGRHWENLDSDGTATTHFTLQGRPSHDCTLGSRDVHIGSQHDFDVKQETYLVEFDSNLLGKDSNGNPYDAVQVRATNNNHAPFEQHLAAYAPQGNFYSVFAILSEPRYAGRACTGAEGRVKTED